MRSLWFLGLCAAVCVAQPANVLTNGGFDAALVDGAVPGWHPFQSDGGAYSQGIVRPGRDGGQAWAVLGEAGYAGLTSDPVALEAGKSYAVGGWLRCRGTGRATIKLDYSTDGKYLGSDYGGFVSDSDGWHEVRVMGRPAEHPGATEVALAVTLEGPGVAQFDDCWLAVPDSPGEPAGNLLANGGMESGLDVTPLWINTFHSEAGAHLLTWTPDAAHAGLRGLRLQTDGEWLVAQHEPVPYDATKTYLLTGWVRVKSGSASLKFDFLKDGQWLGQQASELAPATGEWVKLELPLAQPQFEGVTHLATAAVIEGAGSSADFDDLRLEAR